MPLARLNIPSVFLSRQRDEGATTEDGMKSPLRASCSDKRRTGFPASLSVARPSYTFLMGAVVLPQLSGKSRNLPGTFGGSYSVLMIPTSAPQCPHFIYKSGYRPLWGILVCVFVPFTASSNFHPHFGQYTGRIFISYVILFNLLLALAQTGHSFPPEPIRLPGSRPAICAQLFLHYIREPMRHRSGKKPRVEVCHL